MSDRCRTRCGGDEGGFVLIWFATLLLSLLIFVGFAIDVAQWWLVAQRTQRAADAAALAGVVHMPGAPASARSTAQSEAARNGYAATAVSVFDSSSRPGALRPNQLEVRVGQTVNNFFANLVGLSSTTISRSAVAEFAEPMRMGSPINSLGNDPETQSLSETNPARRLPQLWLNVAGPLAGKGAGDRFTSGGSGNSEFDPMGHFFTVRVSGAAVASELRVEVFDPAYVWVGDNCSRAALTPEQLTAISTSHRFGGVSPATRYASGSASPYCTGDNDVGADNLRTTFTLRRPDATPWNPRDNEIVCSQTYEPYGRSTDLYTALTTDSTFRSVFRRWVRLCDGHAVVESAPGGDWVVQVETNGAGRGGHNRFSLRAGTGNGTAAPNSSGVAVFAEDRLPIYANSTGDPTPTFYLARVVPAAVSGRTLKLEFWDIGDVSGGTTNMRVVPPAEARRGSATGAPLSSFSSCSFRRDGSAISSSSCGLTALTTGDNNGRLISADVIIPGDYWCDSSRSDGCWVRVEMSYSSGATPQDTTTWGATIDGDPVRLIR